LTGGALTRSAIQVLEGVKVTPEWPREACSFRAGPRSATNGFAKDFDRCLAERMLIPIDIEREMELGGPLADEVVEIAQGVREQ
jgi:hypothetical protein